MSHTLLVADENTSIHRMIELAFADEDMRVICVSDGQQALARVKAERPDLVVADVALAAIDGYRVAEEISLDRAGVPVLLTAGAFDPIDEDRLRKSEAAGVLVKPFEPGVLVRRVKELLIASGHAAARGDVVSAEATRESRKVVPEHRTGAPEHGTAPTHPSAPNAPSAPDFDVADAFDLLFAAEQGEPVSLLSFRELSDHELERVASRVAERLATRGLNEQVTHLVRETAERLIKEEIEKIRARVEANR